MPNKKEDIYCVVSLFGEKAKFLRVFLDEQGLVRVELTIDYLDYVFSVSKYGVIYLDGSEESINQLLCLLEQLNSRKERVPGDPGINLSRTQTTMA
jgi:hypothetical protein